ncbi:MAG: T9SS type B sorting domain-containing protein [Bacteroidetes bacterium]|nr:T9SS type B sorting domain-containing protein [Bacteroidota bacterium]
MALFFFPQWLSSRFLSYLTVLVALAGWQRVQAQTPDYWIHEPGVTGVNNTFFHGSICEKFIFSYSGPEWAAAGLPGAIPYEISSIWFRSNSPDLCTFTTFKVQIGHSSLTAPAPNYLSNFDLGGPTTCLDETAFDVEFIAGPFSIVSDGWSKIDLTTPFLYNGTDNLMVLIEFTTPVGCGVPLYGDLGTSTCRYSASTTAVSSTNLTWRPMFGISAVEEPPTAEFIVDADSLCEGACLNFVNTSFGGPTAYEWNFPGSLTPSIGDAAPGPVCYETAGTYPYWLAVSNSLGSDTAFGSVVVEATQLPDLGNDTSYCQGQSLTLASSTAVDQPLWSDGSSSPELLVTEPGLYWLEATGFCPGRDSIEIAELELPMLNLGPPTANLCEGDTLFLDAGDPAYTYSWNTGATGASLMVLEDGLYTVTASNEGCSAEASLEVAFEICGCTVTVPNAFTPNQDGLNDRFRPVANCGGIERYALQVWNRWGEVVYQSQDPFTGWDGTYRGKSQELGSYIWHLEVTFQDQGRLRTRTATGTLTLIP